MIFFICGALFAVPPCRTHADGGSKSTCELAASAETAALGDLAYCGVRLLRQEAAGQGDALLAHEGHGRGAEMFLEAMAYLTGGESLGVKK